MSYPKRKTTAPIATTKTDSKIESFPASLFILFSVDGFCAAFTFFKAMGLKAALAISRLLTQIDSVSYSSFEVENCFLSARRYPTVNYSFSVSFKFGTT